MIPTTLARLRVPCRFTTDLTNRSGTLIARSPSSVTVDWDDVVRPDGTTKYGDRQQIACNTEVLVDDPKLITETPLNNNIPQETRSNALGTASRYNLQGSGLPSIAERRILDAERPAKPVDRAPAGSTVPGWPATSVLAPTD